MNTVANWNVLPEGFRGVIRGPCDVPETFGTPPAEVELLERPGMQLVAHQPGSDEPRMAAADVLVSADELEAVIAWSLHPAEPTPALREAFARFSRAR